MRKFLSLSAIITLVIVVSFAVQAANAKAETLEECLKNYQAAGLSYDQAKLKCSNILAPAATQVAPVGQTQPAPGPTPTGEQPKTISPLPSSPVDDCIRKYISTTGNTYEDAKAKCAAVTPIYSPGAAPQEMTPLEQCAKKYMNSGYTLEQARKTCATEAPAAAAVPGGTPVRALEGCVQKYVEVFNISAADAKAKCATIAPPTATAVQVIEKRSNCANLENQLAELTRKIQQTQGEDIKNVMSKITTLKQALVSCQAPATSVVAPCIQARKNIADLEERLQKGASDEEAAKIKAVIEQNRRKLTSCGQAQATPGVKNPCDEVPQLKSAYEAMLNKEVQTKDLISQGQMDQAALEPIERQLEFLKKRLEQMQFACSQGTKPIVESSCGRLAKLEIVYSQNQDQNLVKEISALKEKCLGQNLTTEKTDNLADVEETYKAKIKAVIENTFGQDQVDNLKKAENEKNQLISDVLGKIKELDATNISIVKKIRFGNNKILLDGVQGNPVPVKIDVNGKAISVDQSGGKVVIDDGSEVKAEGSVNIDYEDGKLVGAASGKPINVLPSEIKDKIGAEPASIELQDKATPVYVVKVDAQGKLFGFIPVSIGKNFSVDAQTGATSQAPAPWWSFLVKY